MIAHEVNFDGIVGPTHNYAGLAYGNLASQQWRGNVSSPKAAALEGLRKMKLLADLGVPQAVLPPPPRPDFEALRRLGFGGSESQLLHRAAETNPVLLASCYSASSMWAANAATVSPSADTTDGRIHFTPANLVSQLHRSLETSATARHLRAIFADENYFAVHEPLPASAHLADEGAANHMRLTSAHGDAGLECFVFGRSALNRDAEAPKRFPARQTREASTAIARLHGLRESATIVLQQSPAAIDGGAFHNDVVAVTNLNVMLFHESAFDPAELDTLRQRTNALSEETGLPFYLIAAREADLSLADAVGSYLFNSQIVSLPDGKMALIAPANCLEFNSVQRYIDRVLAAENPITAVHYVELNQSMRNGGGPACLRLRVVMTPEQRAHTAQGVFLTNSLYERLITWVQRHYRDRLAPADLADVQLAQESRRALEALGEILNLPVFK